MKKPKDEAIQTMDSYYKNRAEELEAEVVALKTEVARYKGYYELNKEMLEMEHERKKELLVFGKDLEGS